MLKNYDFIFVNIISEEVIYDISFFKKKSILRYTRRKIREKITNLFVEIYLKLFESQEGYKR